MKRIAGLGIVLLLAGCAGGDAAPQDETAGSQAQMTLEGVWELTQLNTPDGPDETMRGHLIVSGDFVCHLRVAREREGFVEDEDEAAAAARAATLFNQQAAACGRFTRQQDRLTVQWMTASSPDTEGNSSEFILGIERDQLSLSPAATNGDFAFIYRRPAG